MYKKIFIFLIVLMMTFVSGNVFSDPVFVDDLISNRHGWKFTDVDVEGNDLVVTYKNDWKDRDTCKDVGGSANSGWSNFINFRWGGTEKRGLFLVAVFENAGNYETFKNYYINQSDHYNLENYDVENLISQHNYIDYFIMGQGLRERGEDDYESEGFLRRFSNADDADDISFMFKGLNYDIQQIYVKKITHDLRDYSNVFRKGDTFQIVYKDVLDKGYYSVNFYLVDHCGWASTFKGGLETRFQKLKSNLAKAVYFFDGIDVDQDEVSDEDIDDKEADDVDETEDTEVQEMSPSEIDQRLIKKLFFTFKNEVYTENMICESNNANICYVKEWPENKQIQLKLNNASDQYPVYIYTDRLTEDYLENININYATNDSGDLGIGGGLSYRYDNQREFNIPRANISESYFIIARQKNAISDIVYFIPLKEEDFEKLLEYKLLQKILNKSYCIGCEIPDWLDLGYEIDTRVTEVCEVDDDEEEVVDIPCEPVIPSKEEDDEKEPDVCKFEYREPLDGVSEIERTECFIPVDDGLYRKIDRKEIDIQLPGESPKDFCEGYIEDLIDNLVIFNLSQRHDNNQTYRQILDNARDPFINTSGISSLGRFYSVVKDTSRAYNFTDEEWVQFSAIIAQESSYGQHVEGAVDEFGYSHIHYDAWFIDSQKIENGKTQLGNYIDVMLNNKHLLDSENFGFIENINSSDEFYDYVKQSIDDYLQNKSQENKDNMTSSTTLFAGAVYLNNRDRILNNGIDFPINSFREYDNKDSIDAFFASAYKYVNPLKGFYIDKRYTPVSSINQVTVTNDKLTYETTRKVILKMAYYLDYKFDHCIHEMMNPNEEKRYMKNYLEQENLSDTDDFSSQNIGLKIRNKAREKINVPYKGGGREGITVNGITYNPGLDCIGLQFSVLVDLGFINPTQETIEVFGNGAVALDYVGDHVFTVQKNTFNQLKPGDFLFFNDYGHSGIYEGFINGNHRFIHASKNHKRVLSDNLDEYVFSDRPIHVARIENTIFPKRSDSLSLYNDKENRLVNLNSIFPQNLDRYG